MLELPRDIDPARPPSAPAAWDDARLWHAGWGLGLVTAGAALLIGLGGLPALALAALALAALPGGAGWLLGPKLPKFVLPMLAGWAVAGAAAAGLTGGLGGPLGLWCALPLLASAVLAGGRVKAGAVLALAAAALVAALQYLGRLPAPPPQPAAALVGGVGVVALLAAGAKAMADLMKAAREAEAERGLMARFTAELPCLALSLSPEGAVEAAYGSGLPGLEEAALDAGLIEAAAEAERAELKATLCYAMDHGAAETVLHPAAAPDRPLSLSLRRNGEEGLSAVLQPLRPAAAPAQLEPRPEPPPPVAETPTPQADPTLEAKLAAVVAERDQALQSAQAKARFLANMSHELRTPLNAIMGFSDIMRSRLFGELSPRYGDYAELIHESGRHLLDLINDVLDMSKIEADRYVLALEDFDAREPVQAALRLVRLQADEAGVTLRGVLPGDPIEVEADRRAIKQTVLNLVSNALKFTPRGGQITVSLAPVDTQILELTVADTGVGIAPDDLSRLGQPYEQAGAADQRAMGTGLGLSLVKALAQLHGGSMAIESQLGEGAAVTVRLPVLIEEKAPEAQTLLPFEAGSAAKPQAEPASEAAPAEPTDEEPVSVEEPVSGPVSETEAEAQVDAGEAEADAEPRTAPDPTPAEEPASPRPEQQQRRPSAGAEVIPLRSIRPGYGSGNNGGESDPPPSVA